MIKVEYRLLTPIHNIVLAFMENQDADDADDADLICEIIAVK